MFDPRPNEGKNGQAVVIPSHELLKMQQLFQINRFNLMASDRIPLDRSLPDMRKKRWEWYLRFLRLKLHRHVLHSVTVVFAVVRIPD